MKPNVRQTKQRTPPESQKKTETGKQRRNSDGEVREENQPSENMEEGNQRGDNLQLSIAETQPHEPQ